MLILPAVLLLVQQEFTLGYAKLGLLVNAAFLCYGIGALPAGMLADRLGGERILAIWLLGGSLACVGVGLSASPFGLGIALAILGLFASLHHPAGSGVLVTLRNVPGVNVGRAFGLVGVLGNVGLASAPFVAAAVGVRWGWRAAFLVGAIPTFLLGLIIWRYAAAPRHGGERVSATHGAERSRSYWSRLTLPVLLLFALETLMGFIFQGFLTFLPAHLAERSGIPGLSASQVTRGGSLASLALLVGGLGQLAGGRLMAFRYRETIFLAILSGTMLCLFGMGGATGPLLVIFSIAMAMGHFSLGIMSNTFIASYTPPHLGGTAFGITFGLSLGVGSLASSTMGFVGERFGLPAIFPTLSLVAAGGVALVLWFGFAVGAWSHKDGRFPLPMANPRPPSG